MRGNEAIYLVRVGDGATHKLGATHMVCVRLPRLAGKLRQPVTLVACWRGDRREERRIHEALAPAAVEPRLGRRLPCEVYLTAHPLFARFLAEIPETLRRDLPYTPRGRAGGPGAERARLRRVDMDVRGAAIDFHGGCQRRAEALGLAPRVDLPAFRPFLSTHGAEG